MELCGFLKGFYNLNFHIIENFEKIYNLRNELDENDKGYNEFAERVYFNVFLDFFYYFIDLGNVKTK